MHAFMILKLFCFSIMRIRTSTI